MIFETLKKIFKTANDRKIQKLIPYIDQINLKDQEIKKLSDEKLRQKTAEFKEKLNNKAPMEEILVESFSVVRQAAHRVLGLRPYDVQLIGALILHQGGISEMKTGEGKTLVATLPAYLNALSGKGVHIVTVNDYLASRDCEWMGKLYQFLNLSTGKIVHSLNDPERKKNYACDITYGTNNEFGFDYLRDNMKFELEDYVQRKLNYAIIDECDSILIDEARTPLIISGPSEESTDLYYQINQIIHHFDKEKDFILEAKTKSVSLTESGNAKAEKLLKVSNIYSAQNIHKVHFIYQGLRAHHLYEKEIDYMVQNDEIIIVDEFTGRLMAGRRWSEGLHQAIEAKENVSIKSENQTLASITFQNYFRMYDKISGMTGTAETEALEFQKIYQLDVCVIPTHKPVIRADENDIVYKTEKAKWNCILEDIKEKKEKSQPVLVGTVSIEKSEKISQFLKQKGISHNILNAKYHEKEAEIIAQAGRKSSVTIATNMAGRGTDIMLGGNPEFMAKKEIGDEDIDKNQAVLEKYKQKCEEEKKEVLKAGGLYIIGTERHESRRIDNQLRGRSGRQGDPGASRFYLSLEDKLMVTFNGERLQKIMNTLKVPDDEPIESKMVSHAIEGAQRKVEAYQFDVRKHLLEYDDVMNQQRHLIYSQRKEVLLKNKLSKLSLDMLSESVSEILDTFIPENSKKDRWDLEGLSKTLKSKMDLQIDEKKLGEFSESELINFVKDEAGSVYHKKLDELKDQTEEVQKMLLLQIIDKSWKQHLAHMDQLREGINLRAYAQKDPLIEYKKESFKAFERMNAGIRNEYIEKFIRIQIAKEDEIEFFERNLDSLRMTHESLEDIMEDYRKAKQKNEKQMEASRASEDSPTMNREQRRKMNKNKRKRRW